jgi:hypothetical protein
MSGKNPGNTAKKEETSEVDDKLVIQQLQALSNVVNNGPLLLLVEDDDNSPPVISIEPSTQTISSNQSNSNASKRSVVHEDKEAGPVVNAFENAIQVFGKNPEMSFEDFENMFVKLGIGGDLHEDDEENKTLKDFPAARANMIELLKSAIQLLNEPREGVSALIRDKLMRAAFLANGCLAARSRALSDAMTEIDKVCVDGSKHVRVLRKPVPLVKLIGGCLMQKFGELLECQTLSEIVKYKELKAWAKAALHAAAVYETMVCLKELDCTIDFTFQPMCDLAEQALTGGPTGLIKIVDQIIKLEAHWNAVWCIACPALSGLPSTKDLYPSGLADLIERVTFLSEKLIEQERSKKKPKSSNSNDDELDISDMFSTQPEPASEQELFALIPSDLKNLPAPYEVVLEGHKFTVTCKLAGSMLIIRLTSVSKTDSTSAITIMPATESDNSKLTKLRNALRQATPK